MPESISHVTHKGIPCQIKTTDKDARYKIGNGWWSKPYRTADEAERALYARIDELHKNAMQS